MNNMVSENDALLSEETRTICHQFDVKYPKFNKYRNISGFFAITSFVLAVIIFANTPINSNTNPIVYFGILGAVIAIGAASYTFWKSNQYKISGFQINVLSIFRSFNSLEQLKNDDDPEQLKKSKEEIRDAVYNLKFEFGDYKRINPPLMCFIKPISDLIRNLEFGLLPFFDKIDTGIDLPALSKAKLNDKKINKISQIEKIQKTLVRLIEFLLSENFNDIELVNKELLENYPLKIKEEKNFMAILFNKSYLKLIPTMLGIAAGTAVIAYMLKIVFNGMNTDFVNWWLVLVGPIETGYALIKLDVKALVQRSSIKKDQS